MGNCLQKLKKKTKVEPASTVEIITMKKETTVSEILSLSSTSVRLPSLSSEEDINMVKAFKLSSDDDTSTKAQSLQNNGNIIDELKDKGKHCMVFYS